jgi:polyisoprenoid-binding protein YceI
MTVTTGTELVPGYVAGTWDIDPVHTDVSFSVRHMMVSKVRGRFTGVKGEVVTGEDPLASSVVATIDLSSIDTANEQRDAHIRSADFFDVERFPTMSYRSTALKSLGKGRYLLEGELDLHGVVRAVPLEVELNGFTADPYGGTRVGFSATGEINRKDFDISIDLPMDGGGVVVGDRIQISLEVEAILRSEN